MRKYVVTSPNGFQKHGGKLYPTGTIFTNLNGNLFHETDFMCAVHSDKAFSCLTGDDDGEGFKRREWIDKLNRLIRFDFALMSEEEHERRLRILWSLKKAKKYCRGGSIEKDPWLWNDAFYCAPIRDLEFIYHKLTKEEEAS